METIEKLKELYNLKLKDELLSLESQRKEILKRHLISGFSLLLGALCFVFENQVGKGVLFTLGLVMVLLFFVSLWFTNKKVKIYKKEFKNNVVKKVLYLIDPEWTYEPSSFINQNEYSQSGIFTKSWDRYRGDDLIHGVIDKTDFRLSELHTEYKTVSVDSKGRRTESWHTIFKGLFAHADFNKKIKGETYILPDVAEKLFGKWGQKLQGNNSRGQLVKLENLEFEKNFVVYSNDQIEARYILTPKMMEAIVSIKKQLQKEIYISFIESRVYIAISIGRDLFEPRVFKSGVKYSDIEHMYFYFNIISVVISEMNLNTRIWTKE